MYAIGKCKGFMINGTTQRMRVYGTQYDIGVDLKVEQVSLPVQQAIEALRRALELEYNMKDPAMLEQQFAVLPGKQKQKMLAA